MPNFRMFVIGRRSCGKSQLWHLGRQTSAYFGMPSCSVKGTKATMTTIPKSWQGLVLVPVQPLAQLQGRAWVRTRDLAQPGQQLVVLVVQAQAPHLWRLRWHSCLWGGWRWTRSLQVHPAAEGTFNVGSLGFRKIVKKPLSSTNLSIPVSHWQGHCLPKSSSGHLTHPVVCPKMPMPYFCMHTVASMVSFGTSWS